MTARATLLLSGATFSVALFSFFVFCYVIYCVISYVIFWDCMLRYVTFYFFVCLSWHNTLSFLSNVISATVFFSDYECDHACTFVKTRNFFALCFVVKFCYVFLGIAQVSLQIS